MYLVVIAWMYVVLMMSVAEATNTTGSVLGAIVTFFLYGILPVSIVVYLMRSPARRKAMKAREAAEDAARAQAALATSTDPDAGGQAAGAAETGGVAAVATTRIVSTFIAFASVSKRANAASAFFIVTLSMMPSPARQAPSFTRLFSL